MRTINFIILIFIASLVFSANVNEKEEKTTTKSVSGKVVDRLTGENLAGVKIEIPNTDIIAYSDFEGNFTIAIPSNNEVSEVNISYISYENTKLNLSSLNENLEIMILPITR
jgi:hypothetical protein